MLGRLSTFFSPLRDFRYVLHSECWRFGQYKVSEMARDLPLMAPEFSQRQIQPCSQFRERKNRVANTHHKRFFEVVDVNCTRCLVSRSKKFCCLAPARSTQSPLYQGL